MKTKKLIAFLLTVIMIVGSIPVFSISAIADSVTYTEVSTYDALTEALGQKKNVKLTADITFPTTAPESAIAELWDGANIDGNGKAFNGVVIKTALFTVEDGAHFTVKNLAINATLTPVDVTEGSCFGVIGNSLTNVSCDIENVNVTVDADMDALGGIAGFFGAIVPKQGGTVSFTNCTVNGTVDNNKETSGEYWANGFVGKIGVKGESSVISRVEFKNCVNNAAVSGARYVSGFCGEAYVSTYLYNCINNGAMYAFERYVSGFISYCENINTCLDGCVNKGNITSDIGNVAAGSFETLGFAGIVAWIQSTETKLTKTTNEFVGCKNYGLVNAGAGLSQNNYQYGVGGIAGGIDATNIEVSFNRCSNFAAITSNETGLGGILGTMEGTCDAATVNFVKCLNMGTLTNKRNVAPMLGVILAQNNCTINITSCVNVADILSAGGRHGYMIGFCYNPGNQDKAYSSYTFAANISNCMYIGAVGAIWDKYVDTTTVVNPPVDFIDDTVKTLNGYCMGYFYNDSGTIKYDNVRPQLVGSQDTYTSGATTMDLRFVAVLNTDNLINYSELGFKITPVGSGAQTTDVKCTTVFTSLLAQNSSSAIEYTAGELGGNYIYALSITDVPVTSSFTVTPYVKLQNGSIKEGVSWTMSYTNGVLSGTIS